MSRTEDAYRRKDARRKGYLAGKYGDARDSNPYRGVETHGAWEDGWQQGQQEARAALEEKERLRERGGCTHRILVCGACLTEYCDGCRSYQCPHEDKALLAALEGVP